MSNNFESKTTSANNDKPEIREVYDESGNLELNLPDDENLEFDFNSDPIFEGFDESGKKSYIELFNTGTEYKSNLDSELMNFNSDYIDIPNDPNDLDFKIELPEEIDEINHEADSTVESAKLEISNVIDIKPVSVGGSKIDIGPALAELDLVEEPVKNKDEKITVNKKDKIVKKAEAVVDNEDSEKQEEQRIKDEEEAVQKIAKEVTKNVFEDESDWEQKNNEAINERISRRSKMTPEELAKEDKQLEDFLKSPEYQKMQEDVKKRDPERQAADKRWREQMSAVSQQAKEFGARIWARNKEKEKAEEAIIAKEVAETVPEMPVLSEELVAHLNENFSGKDYKPGQSSEIVDASKNIDGAVLKPGVDEPISEAVFTDTSNEVAKVDQNDNKAAENVSVKTTESKFKKFATQSTEVIYKSVASRIGVKFLADIGLTAWAKLGDRLADKGKIDKDHKLFKFAKSNDIYRLLSDRKNTKEVMNVIMDKKAENKGVASKVEAVRSKIENNERLTPEEKKQYLEKLESILTRASESSWENNLKTGDELQKLTKSYLQAKSSTVGILKDATNTALTLTGAIGLRAVMYGAAAASERLLKSSKEYNKENAGKEGGGKPSKIKFMARDLCITSVKETIKGFKFSDTDEKTGRKLERWERGVNFVRSLGTLNLVGGMGLEAFKGLSGSSHLFDKSEGLKNFMTAMKEPNGSVKDVMYNNFMDSVNRGTLGLAGAAHGHVAGSQLETHNPGSNKTEMPSAPKSEIKPDISPAPKAEVPQHPLGRSHVETQPHAETHPHAEAQPDNKPVSDWEDTDSNDGGENTDANLDHTSGELVPEHTIPGQAVDDNLNHDFSENNGNSQEEFPPTVSSRPDDGSLDNDFSRPGGNSSEIIPPINGGSTHEVPPVTYNDGGEGEDDISLWHEKGGHHVHDVSPAEHVSSQDLAAAHPVVESTEISTDDIDKENNVGSAWEAAHQGIRVGSGSATEVIPPSSGQTAEVIPPSNGQTMETIHPSVGQTTETIPSGGGSHPAEVIPPSSGSSEPKIGSPEFWHTPADRARENFVSEMTKGIFRKEEGVKESVLETFKKLKGSDLTDTQKTQIENILNNKNFEPQHKVEKLEIMYKGLEALKAGK